MCRNAPLSMMQSHSLQQTWKVATDCTFRVPMSSKTQELQFSIRAPLCVVDFFVKFPRFSLELLLQDTRPHPSQSSLSEQRNIGISLVGFSCTSNSSGLDLSFNFVFHRYSELFDRHILSRSLKNRLHGVSYRCVRGVSSCTTRRSGGGDGFCPRLLFVVALIFPFRHERTHTSCLCCKCLSYGRCIQEEVSNDT